MAFFLMATFLPIKFPRSASTFGGFFCSFLGFLFGFFFNFYVFFWRRRGSTAASAQRPAQKNKIK